MNIDKKTTEKITWDIDFCKAEGEITIENGKILGQNICIFKEPETQGSIGNRFSSDDPQFIRDVHRALGDYIQHLDGIMRGVSQKKPCHCADEETRHDCMVDCDYTEPEEDNNLPDFLK